MRSRWLLVAVAAASLAGCGTQFGWRRARLAPWGLRLGYVDFSGFEQAELDDRPALGAYSRVHSTGAVTIEASIDAAVDAAAPEWQLYAVGLSALVLPSNQADLYVHVGGGALIENTPQSSYTAGYVSYGVGYSIRTPATRIDVRASWWQILESANSSTAMALTVGYGF